MKASRLHRNSPRGSRLVCMLQAAVAIGSGGLLVAAGFVLGSQLPGPLPPPIVNGTDASDRYLTHVSTDKPIYRTGEKIYVRAVVLEPNSHYPMTNPGTASFEVKGPKGDTVASGAAAIIDSVAGFSWDIPLNQAGGEYTVRVFNPSNVPAERKFDIRAYRAPRLKSQIVFLRDGYGPGDQVAASLHVERAEGGIPSGARVSVTARVDGEDTWKGEAIVDASGDAAATFRLPAAMARGDGIIAMVVQDGGTVETASKTIPILLQTVDLAIYPEGGDLIAALPNRVYIEGRTPAKKPADTAGVIVDAQGKEVSRFRTEHEGRGRFSFIPAKGKTYSLRVTEPAGIKTVFPLPPVKESGAIISSVSDVTPKEVDPVVRVGATAEGTYSVSLTQRGKEFSFKRVSLRAYHTTNVTFTVPKSLDGVIVATVYDSHNTPMAERLLFRQPEHKLKVRITADRTDYVPGDKVTLRVSTTDDAGKPVGAVVGLTVTDSSVLEMIEKREQAPRLPVMVLLENDVRNLSDAHVYLDENNPKAPIATDLLLGTQGWRRFITAGTGSVSGAVTNSSGALVPGATVRAVNIETGLTFDGHTGADGVYAFPNLKAGTYKLDVSSPGFKTETMAGVQVAFRSNVRQNFRLAAGVAQLYDMVQVGGGARRGVLTGVLGGVLRAAQEANTPPDHVQNLPVNGRDLANFVDVLDLEVRDVNLKQRAGLGGGVGGGAFLREADGRKVRGDLALNEAAKKIVAVREYTHDLRPNWSAESRTDFAETVYWNAGVKTDAATGIATVSFNLSDSVTSFRVLADGFTTSGTLGSGISDVESVQPFSIEPKIPLQVTSGDVIQLPVALVNGTSRELRGMRSEERR